MENTTRFEYLRFCKRRALESLDIDSVEQAIASFISDMSKHPETEDHPCLMMLANMLFNGNSSEQVRNFIKGFN